MRADMGPPDWSRIEEIFDALLAHPPEEWERVVDEACGPDQALREEVASLIDHAAHRDRYFDDLARRCGLPLSGSREEGIRFSFISPIWCSEPPQSFSSFASSIWPG